MNHLPIKKILQLFGPELTKAQLLEDERNGLIPPGHSFKSGAIKKFGWDHEELPLLGEKYGFIKKPKAPVAMAVFTTKGGVLKTSLTFNVARIAALHNLKVCVVGLDMQGDITRILGHLSELEDTDDIVELIEKINETRGLADVFNGSVDLEDVILPTDLPNLFYIPETPELVALNESINNINRREYWLKEKIVGPLKSEFDLILMDCSPNWNRLITNALVACDILLSPLECKINNFRNFKVYKHFLREFEEDMRIGFETIFIPTRFAVNKKLSEDILNWYHEHIPGCTQSGIRESVIGEEACALKKSILEHAPIKPSAEEIKLLMQEIFSITENHLNSGRSSVENLRAKEVNSFLTQQPLQ